MTMLHPVSESVQNQLDWHPLRLALLPHAETFLARQSIEQNNLFLPDVHQIEKHLLALNDVKQMIERAGDVSINHFENPLPSLKRIAKQGSLYSSDELSSLAIALHELQKLLAYFNQNVSLTAQEGLNQLLPDYQILREVNQIIAEVIEPSPQSKIKESASPQYAKLLAQWQQKQMAVEEKLATYLRSSSVQLALQENFWRIREGRYVLSVKADSKNKISGIVIDISASENTVFIAPDVIRKENQALIAHQADLDEEIQRILELLSRQLQPFCDDLFKTIDAVTTLDLLLTKARFSFKLKANAYEINHSQLLLLKDTRHPLLLLQGTTVVENSIVIEPETRVVLISGPNTGGKTVILKTLGLLQLMARCGMHLPVAEQSTMPIYQSLFVDIGDTQSLNQNLSTFSGHLTHIKQFFESDTLSQALVLIDEIGAGTDPTEAVVLAEEILKALAARHATSVVTTHLNDLKRLAYQETQSLGFQNACVAFDLETLSPTYKLLQGTAGQSHALAIAKKLGLPESIIDAAQSHLDSKQTPTDELLNQLEIKQAEIILNEHKIAQLLKDVESEKRDLQEQFNRVEGEKQKILEQYRERLRSQFEPVESQLALVKKATKEKSLSPSRQRFQVKHLNQAKEKMQTVLAEELDALYPNALVNWADINIGDTVRSKKMNFQGKVVEKNERNKTLMVQSGLLKSAVTHLEVIAHFKAGQTPKAPKNTHKSHQSENLMTLKRECDVRGLNSDDAINLLEKAMDEAMLEDIGFVECIHGQGTGALKQNIRKALDKLPYIKKYYPAQAVDGGDGKTIIELN